MLLISGNTIPVEATTNCWIPNNFNDVLNRFSKRSRTRSRSRSKKKKSKKLKSRFSNKQHKHPGHNPGPLHKKSEHVKINPQLLKNAVKEYNL